MIVKNGGLGLYDKTNKQQFLISWALQNNYGALGIVHTLDDYRQKGYGKLISKAVCRQIAENGMDVCAVISDGNFSEIMLKKIGLKEISKITWIKIK